MPEMSWGYIQPEDNVGLPDGPFECEVCGRTTPHYHRDTLDGDEAVEGIRIIEGLALEPCDAMDRAHIRKTCHALLARLRVEVTPTESEGT